MSTLKTNNIQHVDRSEPSILLNSDGSVSMGGTVSYEDVTNVDSVGIVTGRELINAQKQVHVGTGVSVKAGGLNVTAGITTVQALQATSGTFSGAVSGSSATLSGQMQSASAVVTGGITATGGNIVMNDSSGSSANRIKLGTSQDLELYHTGSHSFIEHSGTGHLILGGVPNGNNVDIMKAGYSEYMARFKPDSSVDLYWDGNVRLQTTPSGADVTGTLNVTGVSTFTTVTASTSTVNASSDADLRIQTASNNRLVIRGQSSLSNIITQNGNNLSFRHDGGTSGGTEIFLMDTGGIVVGNNKSVEIKDYYGDVSARLENSDSTNNSFRIDVDPDASGASSAFLVRIDGNEKIRVLHGGGITFNGDTSTDNALDDYEEGSFTPTLTCQNSLLSASYTNQDGKYTKIGRMVYFQVYIRLSSKSGGSGQLRVTGLPFTSSGASGAAYGGAVAAYTYNWSGDALDRMMIGSTSSQVQCFIGTSSGTNVNAGAGNLNNDTQMRIFGHYHV